VSIDLAVNIGDLEHPCTSRTAPTENSSARKGATCNNRAETLDRLVGMALP